MATGILSRPPAARTSGRHTIVTQAVKGNASTPKRPPIPVGKGQPPAYTGMNPTQNNAINQQFGADGQIQGAANAMIPGMLNQYGQPMDWSSIPKGPEAQNFTDWQNNSLAAANKAFDTANNRNFDRQTEQKRQELANRGISQDNPEYKNEMADVAQQQNDARNQATSQAYDTVGRNAYYQARAGVDMRQQNVSDATAQYGQPLQTYSGLMGAESPLLDQSYQQSNTLANNNNQAQNQVYVLQHTPKITTGGGGGGGGGGSAGLGGYGGTGMSYQDYLNAQNQAAIARQQGLNALQPSPPSYGAQLGGSLLNTGLLVGGSILAHSFG